MVPELSPGVRGENRMKSIIPCLAKSAITVLFIGLSQALSVQAQKSAQTVVHGFVYDQNGNGVAGATIGAICVDSHSHAHITSQDGSYSIDLPQEGTCTLEASATSFASTQRTIHAEPNTGSIDFVLKIQSVVADVTVSADEDASLS